MILSLASRATSEAERDARTHANAPVNIEVAESLENLERATRDGGKTWGKSGGVEATSSPTENGGNGKKSQDTKL